MQPAHVSLWLREGAAREQAHGIGRRLALFAASTVLGFTGLGLTMAVESPTHVALPRATTASRS